MPREPQTVYTVQAFGISDVPLFELTADARRELKQVLAGYGRMPSKGLGAFLTGFQEACARSVGEQQRWATNPAPSELRKKFADTAEQARALRASLLDLTGNLDGGTAAVALTPRLAHISAEQLLALEALANELASTGDGITVRRGPPPQTHRYTLARDITQLATENDMPLEIGDDRPEGHQKNFLCSLFSAALTAVEDEVARMSGKEISQLVPHDVRIYLRKAADRR